MDGGPGMLWALGLQRVGHDWASELNWTEVHDREINKSKSQWFWTSELISGSFKVFYCPKAGVVDVRLRDPDFIRLATLLSSYKALPAPCHWQGGKRLRNRWAFHCPALLGMNLWPDLDMGPLPTICCWEVFFSVLSSGSVWKQTWVPSLLYQLL